MILVVGFTRPQASYFSVRVKMSGIEAVTTKDLGRYLRAYQPGSVQKVFYHEGIDNPSKAALARSFGLNAVGVAGLFELVRELEKLDPWWKPIWAVVEFLGKWDAPYFSNRDMLARARQAVDALLAKKRQATATR